MGADLGRHADASLHARRLRVRRRSPLGVAPAARAADRRVSRDPGARGAAARAGGVDALLASALVGRDSRARDAPDASRRARRAAHGGIVQRRRRRGSRQIAAARRVGAPRRGPACTRARRADRLAIGRQLAVPSVRRPAAAVGGCRGRPTATQRAGRAIADAVRASRRARGRARAVSRHPDGSARSRSAAGRIDGHRGRGPARSSITKAVRDLLRRMRAPAARRRARGSALGRPLLGELLESLLRLAVGCAGALRARAPAGSSTDRLASLLEPCASARPRHHARSSSCRSRLKECDALVRNLPVSTSFPYATLGPFSAQGRGQPVLHRGSDSLARSTRVRSSSATAFRVTEQDRRRSSIPGTIQEVIMGRVDRLPGAAARAPGRVGHRTRFPPRSSQRVVGGARHLDWALGYLKKRQLIVERSGERRARVSSSSTRSARRRSTSRSCRRPARTCT